MSVLPSWIAWNSVVVVIARRVAGTMPLIFHVNGDPVEAKLLAIYAHPGGTVTGVTNLSEALSRKRVERPEEHDGHGCHTSERNATHRPPSSAAVRPRSAGVVWDGSEPGSPL